MRNFLKKQFSISAERALSLMIITAAVGYTCFLGCKLAVVFSEISPAEIMKERNLRKEFNKNKQQSMVLDSYSTAFYSKVHPATYGVLAGMTAIAVTRRVRNAVLQHK